MQRKQFWWNAWLLSGLAGKEKKEGNAKVNEFDESISSTPDFHVKEVM